MYRNKVIISMIISFYLVDFDESIQKVLLALMLLNRLRHPFLTNQLHDQFQRLCGVTRCGRHGVCESDG